VIVVCCHRSRASVFFVLLIIGCARPDDVSEERLAQMAGGHLKDVVPVSGKVLVDGVPQGGVNIYLYKSTGGKAITECRTDDDGTYCWTTHIECDGIEPGEYRLGFRYVPKPKRNDKGTDLFKGRYSDPMQVEYLLTVAAESPQSDADYELTTK
jgi:5-hydroxyisourate hydrolase-like protein (transthyretin family)